MKLVPPGSRWSDGLIQRTVAGILNIPETEEMYKTASGVCECKEGESCSVCKKDETEKQASACPQCGAGMLRSGAMEKCSCGYAQANGWERATKKVAEEKKPSETSVKDYWKKLFPDAYANELTGTPHTGPAGTPVKYEIKPSGTLPGAKKSKTVISVRDILAAEHCESGVCEVPDADPTPGEDGVNATETPDPRWQSGDSANSVSGPERAKSHGGPAKQESGDVQAPDLGVPRGARRKKADGRLDLNEHGANSVDGPVPPKPAAQSAKTESGSVNAPDLGVPKGASKDNDPWISREAIAQLCPPCAEEMTKRGIKRVRASFIARQIAVNAPQRMKKEAAAPKGWEPTVKKMKKHPGEVDNPWALANWMKNKGYTPGGK